jgi:hypothetical protein
VVWGNCVCTISQYVHAQHLPTYIPSLRHGHFVTIEWLRDRTITYPQRRCGSETGFALLRLLGICYGRAQSSSQTTYQMLGPRQCECQCKAIRLSGDGSKDGVNQLILKELVAHFRLEKEDVGSLDLNMSL